VTDYSQLPTPELNKLIHDLSVESRNRYETKRAWEQVQRNINANGPESLSKPDLDRG